MFPSCYHPIITHLFLICNHNIYSPQCEASYRLTLKFIHRLRFFLVPGPGLPALFLTRFILVQAPSIWLPSSPAQTCRFPCPSLKPTPASLLCSQVRSRRLPFLCFLLNHVKLCIWIHRPPTIRYEV